MIPCWRECGGPGSIPLEASPSYRETVAAILAAGFLTGPQTVEVYEVTGGTLSS